MTATAEFCNAKETDIRQKKICHFSRLEAVLKFQQNKCMLLLLSVSGPTYNKILSEAITAGILNWHLAGYCWHVELSYLHSKKTVSAQNKLVS